MRYFKKGTFTGTGATLRVEVGFEPDYVKVINLNDAGTLAPILEWIAGMTDAYAIKWLSIVDSGVTALVSHAIITSLGITPDAGVAGSVKLTGTVAVTAGSAVVTGTSTEFVDELKEGDLINIGDVEAGTSGFQQIVRKVLSIASATSLTVSQDIDESRATVFAHRQAGRESGFLLGADTDVNVDGEAGVWIAMKE